VSTDDSWITITSNNSVRAGEEDWEGAEVWNESVHIADAALVTKVTEGTYDIVKRMGVRVAQRVSACCTVRAASPGASLVSVMSVPECRSRLSARAILMDPEVRAARRQLRPSMLTSPVRDANPAQHVVVTPAVLEIVLSVAHHGFLRREGDRLDDQIHRGHSYSLQLVLYIVTNGLVFDTKCGPWYV